MENTIESRSSAQSPLGLITHSRRQALQRASQGSLNTAWWRMPHHWAPPHPGPKSALAPSFLGWVVASPVRPPLIYRLVKELILRAMLWGALGWEKALGRITLGVAPGDRGWSVGSSQSCLLRGSLNFKVHGEQAQDSVHPKTHMVPFTSLVDNDAVFFCCLVCLFAF